MKTIYKEFGVAVVGVVIGLAVFDMLQFTGTDKSCDVITEWKRFGV